MMPVRRVGCLAVFLFCLAQGNSASSAEGISITPSTFDFGWCPDNAKISASFIIKNTGVDLIPITSVQPTCGCTASQFTPASLASNEETKVGLTFNTRGYAGSSFNKPTKVKTDNGGAEYTVNVKGVVIDSQATFFPDHEGVAGFDTGSKEKKKTIGLQNKSVKDVSLEVIQEPAAWVNAKLSVKNLKAGASVPLEISLMESASETRDTSITIEAKDDMGTTSRLTVAIRTGIPPPPVKRSSTVTPVVPDPTAKPSKTQGK